VVVPQSQRLQQAPRPPQALEVLLITDNVVALDGLAPLPVQAPTPAPTRMRGTRSVFKVADFILDLTGGTFRRIQDRERLSKGEGARSVVMKLCKYTLGLIYMGNK
jgi:hypothetical protein